MTTEEINIFTHSLKQSIEVNKDLAREYKAEGDKGLGDALAAQLVTLAALNNAFTAIVDHRTMKNN